MIYGEILNLSIFIILIPTPDFPHFYYMLGGNLGSLLYGDVSVIDDSKLYRRVSRVIFINLFIQYFKRVTHLAVIAILPCGPLCKHIYIYTNTKVM